MSRLQTTQTDLVVVNRLAAVGADRVVLTSDRGKFWLAGDNPLWADCGFPIRGRATLTFWPGHCKGRLDSWSTNSTTRLDQQYHSLVSGWLDWLNRHLEVTQVSLKADTNTESGRFWQVFDSAWSLLDSRQIPELAGAYFYLRVFELAGQSFQLAESSNRQPLTGDRFSF